MSKSYHALYAIGQCFAKIWTRRGPESPDVLQAATETSHIHYGAYAVVVLSVSAIFERLWMRAEQLCTHSVLSYAETSKNTKSSERFTVEKRNKMSIILLNKRNTQHSGVIRRKKNKKKQKYRPPTALYKHASLALRWLCTQLVQSCSTRSHNLFEN